MSFPELTLSLEQYGSQIPVFVREVLDGATDTQDTSNITFSFNENAWSWLVAGRTVYIWNFKSTSVFCCMLNLPQSGLKHSSELFHVFSIGHYDKQTTIPSCINVSPEGAVRFWMKADAGSTYVDNIIDLSGQVCQSLTKLQHAAGFVLATSTCSLFLVYPPLDRTNSFQIVPMKPPQSFVAGLSRRMTAALFSASVSQENKLIRVRVIADRKQVMSSTVIVLTTKCINCYHVSQPAGNYKFLWESDITNVVIDHALENVWNVKNQQVMAQFRSAVYVNFIDMTIYNRKVCLLVAVRNEAVSHDVYFAITTFSNFDIAVTDLEDFVLLNIRRQIVYDVFPSNYKLHFMHGTSYAFLIGNSEIYCVDISDTKSACLRYTLTEDKVIGSSSFATHVLLFGIKAGLNCVKIGQKSNTTTFADELSTLHQLTHTEEEFDGLVNSSDRYKRFKAAFICFLKQQLIESEKLLEELFDIEMFNDVNELAIQLSLDIIDDYPAADARWTKSVPASTLSGLSGNSLLLLYQLNDKQKTLSLFWEFLKRMGVWKQLTECNSDDGILVDCQWLLLEHAEKLDACIATVENGWEKIAPLMKSVFTSILRKRRESLAADLTAQDLFFRKVSKCEQLIYVLIDEECSDLVGYDQSADKISIILSVNEIILRILKAAHVRRAKFGLTISGKLEYLPWTSVDIVKKALIIQHSLISDFVNEAVEPSRVDFLGQQLKELTECLLSDASDHLRFAKGRNYEERLKEFENWRTKLLEPFILLKQYDKACELGEKFFDYEILIRVCEMTDDSKLLDTYKTTFDDKGFSAFYHNWNLNRGKFSRLFKQSDEKTKEFLNDRADLKWIYDVKNGNFTNAANNLLELANGETESLAKKKTLLSLAKLNALCNEKSESEQFVAKVQQGLDLITVQEKAPVNENFDVLQRPLSVQNLIEVYISDDKADEWSFAKALELFLCYLHDNLSSDDLVLLKSRIWTSAILKDNWKPIITSTSDDPLKASTSTIFSRTVALLLKIYKGDVDNLRKLLPSPESLCNVKALEPLSKSSVFRYVLGARDEELRSYLNSLNAD